MPKKSSESKADSARSRGPEAERVKIEGDWQDAVGKALTKKPPPGGWPKPEKKAKKKPE